MPHDLVMISTFDKINKNNQHPHALAIVESNQPTLKLKTFLSSLFKPILIQTL